MTRTAAEVADGLLVMPFHTQRHFLERTLPAVDAGLRESGRTRDEFTIIPQVIVGVGRGDDQLAAAARGVRACSRSTVRRRIPSGARRRRVGRGPTGTQCPVEARWLHRDGVADHRSDADHTRRRRHSRRVRHRDSAAVRRTCRRSVLLFPRLRRRTVRRGVDDLVSHLNPVELLDQAPKVRASSVNDSRAARRLASPCSIRGAIAGIRCAKVSSAVMTETSIPIDTPPST